MDFHDLVMFSPLGGRNLEGEWCFLWLKGREKECREEVEVVVKMPR